MRVLIVEDDMVIAGAMAPLVAEAGYELVGLAADRDTAAALLSSSKVDLALVDLRLVDGWTGMDVARAAKRNGVATIFTTANPTMLSADMGGALGLIEKPYKPEGLKAALAYVAAKLAGNAAPKRPSCLTLRPIAPTAGTARVATG